VGEIELTLYLRGGEEVDVTARGTLHDALGEWQRLLRSPVPELIVFLNGAFVAKEIIGITGEVDDEDG
jgi:hypothetical protein